jgi:hypothetical protein
MIRALVLGGLAAAVLAATPARAVVLGFDCISNNLAGDCAIGEAQLSVNVTDAGGGTVLFSFSNSGPNASSITDVYFDDGSLLALAVVINDLVAPGNVDFSQGASPGNLPAANNADPDFESTAGFNADSNPPTQPNGVNPGETLGILFTLQGGQIYDDVLAELADGRLRIGIHVQGFASTGSESLVNVPVPEPTTLALLALGAASLVAARSRRS